MESKKLIQKEIKNKAIEIKNAISMVKKEGLERGYIEYEKNPKFIEATAQRINGDTQLKAKLESIFEEAYQIGLKVRSLLYEFLANIPDLSDRYAKRRFASWLEAVCKKGFDDGAFGRMEWDIIVSYIPTSFEAYDLNQEDIEKIKIIGESLYYNALDLGRLFEEINEEVKC